MSLVPFFSYSVSNMFSNKEPFVVKFPFSSTLMEDNKCPQLCFQQNILFLVTNSVKERQKKCFHALHEEYTLGLIFTVELLFHQSPTLIGH